MVSPLRMWFLFLSSLNVALVPPFFFPTRACYVVNLFVTSILKTILYTFVAFLMPFFPRQVRYLVPLPFITNSRKIWEKLLSGRKENWYFFLVKRNLYHDSVLWNKVFWLRSKSRSLAKLFLCSQVEQLMLWCWILLSKVTFFPCTWRIIS